MALASRGGLLCTASADSTLKMWNAHRGELLHTLEGHTKRAWCVAISADESIVASGGEGGAVMLWDAARARRTAGGGGAG